MVTLAAATWKLGIRETLFRLGTEGILKPADTSAKNCTLYVKDHLSPRDRALAFWRDCQKAHAVAETATLRLLQKRLAAVRRDDDWFRRAGRFIGSSDAATVKEWAGPSLFPGRKWECLLSVPYWDMPGRLSGFLHIGREADRDSDYVFQGVVPRSRESGLAMLDALLEKPHPVLGADKFVFTDADVAMRLQCHHMRDTRRPLPLAATWDDNNYRTTAVWEWLSGESTVFWGGDYLQALRQARMADGLVSTFPFERQTLMREELHTTPVAWMQRLRRTAVPWRQALRKHLEELSEPVIEDALAYIDLRGRELDEFITGCRPGLRDRLDYIRRHRTVGVRLEFDNQWVQEKNGGWQTESGKQISNFTMQIEKVLNTPQKSYYQGSVFFKGERYPFMVPTTTLDEGVRSWVSKFLRDEARAGVAELCPRWGKKALDLALRMHPPEYVKTTGSVGWCHEEKQFTFPTFGIKFGRVKELEVSVVPTTNTPAAELPLPGIIPLKFRQALAKRNEETELIWATAACAVANIVAPAVNRNQHPILLAGAGARSVGADSLKRLGCTSIRVPDGSDLAVLIEKVRGGHTWPIVTRFERPAAACEWVNEPAVQNLAVGLSRVGCRMLALRGQYNLIEQTRELGSLQLAEGAVRHIIPNYLQYLSEKQLALPETDRDLAMDVLGDMYIWFKSLGSRPKAVERAKRVLHTPTSTPAATHVEVAVADLHAQGLLPFARAGYDTIGKNIGIVEMPDAEAVWLSQDRFCTAVQADCGLTPDILLITEALEEAGILLGEPSRDNMRGWLLKPDWWPNRKGPVDDDSRD